MWERFLSKSHVWKKGKTKIKRRYNIHARIYSFENLKKIENQKTNDAKQRGQIMCVYVFFDAPNGVNKKKSNKTKWWSTYVPRFSCRNFPKYGCPKFCVLHLIYKPWGTPILRHPQIHQPTCGFATVNNHKLHGLGKFNGTSPSKFKYHTCYKQFLLWMFSFLI